MTHVAALVLASLFACWPLNVEPHTARYVVTWAERHVIATYTCYGDDGVPHECPIYNTFVWRTHYSDVPQVELPPGEHTQWGDNVLGGVTYLKCVQGEDCVGKLSACGRWPWGECE